MRATKARSNADLEWFILVALAAIGIAVFGHVEEKTPAWRRHSKWVLHSGVVTALLSRGPGGSWTFGWVVGLPGVGLAPHVWCGKHGIDTLAAEPNERY
jgi:hypothetical protein